METYIIRIYQRDKNDPKKVTGVVEEIGKEEKKGFISPDSLWRILTSSSRESGRKSGTSRRNG